MDNVRLLLISALVFVLFLIYQAWMHDYGPASLGAPHAPAPTAQTQPKPPSAAGVAATKPATGESVPTVTVAPAQTTSPAAGVGAAPVVHVRTDMIQADISTRGGTIESLHLLHYPIDPKDPAHTVQLFKADTPSQYLAQSGLIGTSKDAAPSHDALFTAAKSDYVLPDGAKTLAVDLTWTSPQGVRVVKRYVFNRGSYVIDLTQEVHNGSSAKWAARVYTQLEHSKVQKPKHHSFVYTYTGAAYYSAADKYKKVKFDDIAKEPMKRDISSGWVAMLQHYFVTAWIPGAGDAARTVYTSSLPGPRYVIGMYSPTVTVAPGATHSFHDRLFAGPELQKHLAQVAPGLDLTVDYGWLTILAQPIFWLLDHLHSLVNNWGVAIILLTILIKGAFFKLSATSYKSMANMRKLTPRLKALKDRYGDDKEKLNQAMMEMYKKEKVNPLGGCLPIAVQIPVFIALYWVLLNSVELRQAHFFLWIQNLSAPDPYYVLPLIMGVSMFLQQKLNPAPVEPIQAKIMMSMPIVFTVFFAFFPAGLVLYWTVNNILSIAQQWHITRSIEKKAAHAK